MVAEAGGRKDCVASHAAPLSVLPSPSAGAAVNFYRRLAIEPGVGATSFCAVVIITMMAAMRFDPRLMWDAAGENDE
jgi:hypothetical protein